MPDQKELVTFNDGEIELSVSLESETVWLNRNQLSELFDRDVKTIGKHINNIFKEGELSKDVVVAKFATTTQHGAMEGKTQTKLVEFYNLDVIISVGYRVKSQRGVRFRQWATSVLKEYIINGYAINTHKITEQRLVNLENDMQLVKSKIQNDTLELKQGIFCDGQIYDAYTFVNDVLKSAKNNVVLIDNFIDDTVLTLFSAYPSLKFTIITKPVSKKLGLDIDKYNAQYNNLTLKHSLKFHDRFLIIDEMEAWHIGASLKDLGKKVFAFSKIEVGFLDLSELEVLDVS